MRRQFLYLYVILLSCISYGQNEPIEKPQENTIKVISRAQKNEILLRWAPTKPISWKQLNEYGYTIERYTVIRDCKRLDNPEGKTLTQTPIIPENIDYWMSIIETNDNAAIIAQAIYGDSFQVGGGDQIETIVAMSEENEQRHTFALYSADRDFNIAIKAALGYRDTTVKPNEKYLYRVISNVPLSRNDISYGGVLVGLEDFKELPVPLDLASVFNDNGVMLSWDYELRQKLYSSYNIERSENNQNFKRINKQPYTRLNQGKNTNSGRIFYVDSIKNNIEYKYRIQGVSSFGELSPYSEIVTGIAGTALKYTPHLIIKKINEAEDSVLLTWEFPDIAESEIKGFELNKSNGKGEIEEVLVNNIASNKRTILYKNLGLSNYFSVSAIGINNDKTTSFPMLVQPNDETPPAPPTEIKGVIDSTGIVKLSWKKNVEPDFFGYRIFRGNLEKEEFGAINAAPIKEETFIDTVSIKNLNSRVYYKIVALDQRYNQSDFSKVITIEKPDIIPPSSPVFKKFEVKDKSVFLDWAKSSSQDAEIVELYRKENDNSEWTLVFEGKNDTESFKDKSVNENSVYSYTLLSKDRSGLESTPSPSVTVKIPATVKDKEVKNLYAVANKNQKTITLTWTYRGDDIVEFEIYKAIDGGKPRLLRIVPSDIRRLEDPNLKINTNYMYGVRAVLKDGRITRLKKYKIKY